MPTEDPNVVIVGAGPAGLTAAYQLTKRGTKPTILEADTVVGGISRTAQRDGWRFDIGGHRFFTKVHEVEKLWFEILGPDDFLRRPRLSRIYYRGKFYDYPLVAMNALRNLGFLEAVRCGLSGGPRIEGPPGADGASGTPVRRSGSASLHPCRRRSRPACPTPRPTKASKLRSSASLSGSAGTS